MRAGEIITLPGQHLLTEKLGDWPGGSAKVIELRPDPVGAPEIAFQVRHTTAIDPETGELWEIGVFEHEQVDLL